MVLVRLSTPIIAEGQVKMKTVKTKLPKSIKRITILSAKPAEAGGMVVKKKRKKKKQSKGVMKLFERLARRSADANGSTSDSYLSRHRRSNKKRRDGWMRDYGYNWVRANRKGGKKFKISKLFG